MRKIERDMIRAVRERKTWKRDNTRVDASDDMVQVYLHGNLIAEQVGHNLTLVEPTLRRWPTVTTRSRLNALGFHVNQQDFEQVVTRGEVSLADV